MAMYKKAILAVLMCAIFVSSLFVTVVCAQSIPKPSVPEFTLKYVDSSYDVSQTYGIDPYTGQNRTINAGYHVDNRTLVFTIKNQPFAPYTDSNGNYIDLYYNFRAKGHYGNNWFQYPFSNHPTDSYPSISGQSTWRYTGIYSTYSPKYPASKLDYTEVSINLQFLNLEDAPIFGS